MRINDVESKNYASLTKEEVMDVFRTQNGVLISDIKDMFDVSPPTAAKYLTQLTDEGLLRVTYLDRRRRKMFYLTDEGRKHLERVEESKNDFRQC